MRESCTYGSKRGALSNERSYRDMMHRRSVLTLLGTAPPAWPMGAQAQQRAVPVVGYLSAGSRSDTDWALPGLRQGMRDVGFIEGQNVSIEGRWAENQGDRLPALAAELVQRRVAVVAASGGVATRAAKAV